jgi:glutamate formiminotransferase/glutamate formiminotransferase/formiminotetrahydrofolate cyclodeaminase
VIECVINVSEGRDAATIATIEGAAGDALLDAQVDADHHRAVLTLSGPDVISAARAVARTAVDHLDLRAHSGVHPRIGVVDVVPFVPLAGSTMRDALAARDDFGTWAGTELALPCFFFGPERSLPDIRRGAFSTISPDRGPGAPHRTAGACAVGARGVLVAYNLWLASTDLALAKDIARRLRSPTIRALGLAVGDHVQVSCNLLAPEVTGPAVVFDTVEARANVARAEVVGLVPRSVLDAVPRRRWAQLDLDDERTIEARIRRWRR